MPSAPAARSTPRAAQVARHGLAVRRSNTASPYVSQCHLASSVLRSLFAVIQYLRWSYQHVTIPGHVNTGERNECTPALQCGYATRVRHNHGHRRTVIGHAHCITSSTPPRACAARYAAGSRRAGRQQHRRRGSSGGQRHSVCCCCAACYSTVAARRMGLSPSPPSPSSIPS